MGPRAYEYQPAIPGLEELEPQPELPFDWLTELDDEMLLYELDAAHAELVLIESLGGNVEDSEAMKRFIALARTAERHDLLHDIAIAA